MEFTEIVELVLSYASMWAPAVASIIAVICAIVTSISKATAAVESLKNDTDFKDVKQQLNKVSTENRELVKCNKMLIDQLTKINGYADAKLGETQHDKETKG